MDTRLLETLLHMGESEVLDFKRDQYPLSGATDDEKSELIKDVVAFANAWRTTDAHIVVGAAENPGGRATIVGVTHHLDDAAVQQLVNSKTNLPVSFEYLPVTMDGRSLAVLRMKAQERPVFLTRKFGKLDPDVVYIRRGSSTVKANPSEIAKMGAAAVSSGAIPQIVLQLGDVDRRQLLGTDVRIISQVVAPPASTPRDQVGMFAVRDPYAPDPGEVVAYRQELRLLKPLGFCIVNTGRILIEDVRIVVEIDKVDDLLITDRLPERPTGPFGRSVAYTSIFQSGKVTDVVDRGTRWEIAARLGKVQPGENSWSREFWLGAPKPVTLDLVARIFADNLSSPLEVPLRISIETEDCGRLGPEPPTGGED